MSDADIAEAVVTPPAPPAAGVDAAIASHLAALHVTLQYLTRDVHTMQDSQRKQQERDAARDELIDQRVRHIEQAVERLLEWQKKALDAANERRANQRNLVNGWAVALFTGALLAMGAVASWLLQHLIWKP